MERIGAAALALVLVGAACSSNGSTDALAGDRIVVLQSDGRLVTMQPDGSDTLELTDGENSFAAQPTWSPDGVRLAWTELGTTLGMVEVVTSRADGSRPTRTAVPFAPFYYYWDPTSSKVAFLGNGATQLELWMVDFTGDGGDARALSAGAPFYFSWSPGGDGMLVHVGLARLERLGLDGVSEDVPEQPGSFQAPVWLRERDALVYAAQTPGGQGVILADGDERAEIVSFNGFIHFVASPDENKLAYRSFRTEQDSVTASLRAQQTVEATPNVLEVLDLETGVRSEISRGMVATFFWSPDSNSLLVLELDESTRLFNWRVWDGETITDYEPFTPSATFGQQYAPFFDQMAQSLTFWSPESDAFVYSGQSPDGETGIWVQPLEGDPTLISDGVFAAWSPAG